MEQTNTTPSRGGQRGSDSNVKSHALQVLRAIEGLSEIAEKIESAALEAIGNIESAKETALGEIETQKGEAKVSIDEKKAAALQALAAKIGGLLGGLIGLAASENSADDPSFMGEADLGYSSSNGPTLTPEL